MTQPKTTETGKRAAIIAAATQVFGERGYDAASTKEIARRAGCGQGLIHHYFVNKEDLLRAVIAERHTTSNEGLQALPPRKTLEQELLQVMLHNIELRWAEFDATIVMLSRALFDTEAAQERHEAAERSRKIYAERLRRHRDLGQLRAGLTPDAAALLLGAAIADLAWQVVLRRDMEAVRAAAKRHARTLAELMSSRDTAAGDAPAGSLRATSARSRAGTQNGRRAHVKLKAS